MELLYAYVEKYRIFEKQEFRFSDRFIVNYDPETNHLDIKPNEEYFDIYPGNIVGVSAVVGKNAAGKTSILSLIGDRIEEKESDEDQNNLNEDSYFMIHYLKSESRRKSYFVFESNRLSRYLPIFELDTREILNCRDQRDSVSFVFSIKDGKARYSKNTQDSGKSNSKNRRQFDTSVVFFRNAGKQFGYKRKEDSWGRREAPLTLHSQIEELKMLVDKIKNATDGNPMFGNGCYYYKVQIAVPIKFTEQSSFLKKASEIMKKLDFDINDIWSQLLTLWIVVLFLIRESEGVGSKSQEIGDDFRQSENTEAVIWGELTETVSDMYPYEFLRVTYDKLVPYLKSSSSRWASYTYPMDMTSRVFEKSYVEHCMSIMNDLAEQSRNHAEIVRDKAIYTMEFKITEDNDLDLLYRVHKYILTNPVFTRYVTTDIVPLSDGERGNLAMFSSIHKQIQKVLSNRRQYILLFDEIERCMHPEMCRCLIKDLIDFLQGYPDKQFQIIIASHSPFIVGDIRKENLICLTAGGKVQKPENLPESFGQNIHTLLKSQFFLDNTFSQYAVDLIKLVSECLQMDSVEKMRKKIRSNLGRREQDDFNKQLGMMANDAKRLPETDEETLAFLRRIIDSIGEPLLRRSLQAQLRKWEQKPLTVDEEIRQLERRLKELRKQRGNNG